MRVGSRLTPRQLATMSCAQLAPSNPADSSNFTVSAEADDQAAIRIKGNSARSGLMASSHMNWAPAVKLLRRKTAGQRAARLPYPPRCSRSGERSGQERGQDAADQEVLHRIIDPPVPGLHALAHQPHLVDGAEHPVEPADVLALFVLGRAFIDDVGRDPAIDRGHGAGAQRPLDVAEQDDAVVAGGVLGVVQIGLVEQDVAALGPVVAVSYTHLRAHETGRNLV